jgi:hypothetical protein
MLSDRRSTYRFRLCGLTVFLSGLLWLSAPACRGAVIGGWSVARGGTYSLAESNSFIMRGIRTGVTNLYPGTTFQAATSLTPEFMESVDVLILLTAFDDSRPVSPLSVAEQGLLHDFVLEGGDVALLAENDFFSDAINDTLLHPFGLNIVGAIGSDATAVVPLRPPLTGPNGPVPFLKPNLAGYFDQLGSAEVLATLDENGQPVMVFIPPNALGPGSGLVLATADSDMFLESGRLIMNSFDLLLVPEPASWMLVLAASVSACGLVACRRFMPAASLRIPDRHRRHPLL